MRELEREHRSELQPSGALGPVAVIGRGRMGRAIVAAAEAADLEARSAGREDLEQALAGCETALLCVPDTEIREACAAALAASAELGLVGHVSGATGLDALAAAGERGASTFSMHPLQTISAPGDSLAGCPAAITAGDERAARHARELATALGMRPFELPAEARVAYHAAASIASNFLVALEQSAVELLASAGIEDGHELLTPLVLRTAANWSERGGAALTGPIARGDEATVAAHLEAIAAGAPGLLPLYRALAERTRALTSHPDRSDDGREDADR